MYTVYRMKTIMVRDDVYKKLLEIKGEKSFSQIIDELIEESLSVRRRKMERYFGTLGEDDAEAWLREIGNMRKKADESINRKFGHH
ncbi:antitoxin VapB family protein [Sulfuracidifex metallicus]|uniref:Putative antitoxin GC250_10215 n=1 Tax=Sulfuracidifex metallicus DSM 6482 = JCM 9184 TaxID=523847 RepID=A0A6A9QKM7_SULME|nr:antitoxin VapB family protein [Sulfuracidifex metallicus]MUN29797.1 antitoxin [Sulfuracidifex metallicus DSM 6482 = JCM 9184]WOE51820.1 antitoxin VapB family protein [Sulfuracidifex metallicus DSM 6482 = JCM 9184]